MLGTIEDDEGRQLVLADIPGLIEGASEGAGLGHEFLAHVERTSLLLHLVDVAPVDGSSPEQAFEMVRAELESHGGGLGAKPFALVLSKIDLLPEHEVDDVVARWRSLLDHRANVRRRDDDTPVVLAVSSATGPGLETVRQSAFDLAGPTPAAPAPEPEPGEQIAEYAVYRPADQSGYSVERSGEHEYTVSGPAVERLVHRHDLDNREALAYIEERLKAMGVIKELESQGFEPGEEVRVGDIAFVLYPGVTAPD